MYVYVVCQYVNVYVYVIVYVYHPHGLIHSLPGMYAFVLHGYCFLALTTFWGSFSPFSESIVIEMAQNVHNISQNSLK